MRTAMRTSRLSLVFAALLAAAAGCARNPATGSNQLMLVSESQEIAMGRQADQEIVASLGLYPDSTWQRYVQSLGSRLAATSERPNLPWTFRVVDDATVNAFAVPGGFIYVTRGILATLNSEAELAGVVGHEIGHVTARHTAASLSRAQIAQLGLVVGSVASPTVARYAGLASQAVGLLFLKFSRDDESQADHLGLRYMGKGGFAESEMPRVFEMLGRVSAASGGSHLPQWLETHPDPENRREAIERELAGLNESGGTINRDQFLRRLDGMVFGMNPRDGYFRGSEFFHPGLRFRMNFPQGWRTMNTAAAVQAMSPNQDAAIQLTLAREPNPDAAARAFLSQQGIQNAGATQGNINGLSAVSAAFAAQTENGVIRGTALFIQHANQVFAVIGYGPESRWVSNQGTVEAAMRTFGPLTDPAAINVQPQRIDVVTVSQRTTIADLARQRPSPTGADMLALINQTEPDAAIEPGRVVKWITGPRFDQASNSP